ncbi:MAG: LysR substrate-binding domain-containing protein [Acidobacteriaceae bacterium]|nr:LysR substrate-binding domain-containing protein [Acidobacteriaceae bacterium]
MYDWAEFRHFLYLLKILELGGLHRAAEVLHTSQPNLSVQARQFQDHAEIKLFSKERNGRIVPTETGYAFISLAPLVLDVRDEVIDALIAIDRGGIDNIRLGCSPLVDQGLFRDLCALHREILPRCNVRPSHEDTVQLTQEVVSGNLDAALVTLPVNHTDLQVEVLRQDRLVVCLRKDDPIAEKAAIDMADLQNKLAVLYHPLRHPDAHQRLLEMLGQEGVKVEEFSRASHPTEMQMLVKEGYGFALIREGTPLDDELTTRRLIGVDWTVDIAAIFNRQNHPKTVPVLVRKLRKKIQHSAKPSGPKKPPASVRPQAEVDRDKRQTGFQFPPIREA